MACQSGQRLLMVLLLTILTSLVSAAPVTEESNTTEVPEVTFLDIEKSLDGPVSELSQLLKNLDEKSVQDNKTHQHLLRSSADILKEIQTKILSFLNDNFPELVTEDHQLREKTTCVLDTNEYEHANLEELCEKFSGKSIGYTVKADVDCILSSLYLINSYLQTLISSHGLSNLPKIVKLSDMLESLADHFQIYKEDITEKIESSCKNYSAILDASKSETANGIGVNETSNNTGVTDMSSVSQNASTVDSEVLSKEDKQTKLEETFEKEKETITEIKNKVHLLNGLIMEFENEEKQAEIFAEIVKPNVTNATIPNVNAEEASLGEVVESNATLPAGSSVTNLTESSVANLTESSVANLIVPSVANLTEPSAANLTETSVANLTESSVANLIVPGVDNLTEPNAANPTESSVANLTESSVLKTEEASLGEVVESNATLPAGSSVANLTESSVVKAEEASLGEVVKTNATLPVEPAVTQLGELNVVSTLKPPVIEATDNVEKNDSDESMLQILKSNSGLANNATSEKEDTFIDEVKKILENKGELPTTVSAPKEDDVEELFEKLF